MGIMWIDVQFFIYMYSRIKIPWKYLKNITLALFTMYIFVKALDCSEVDQIILDSRLFYMWFDTVKYLMHIWTWILLFIND